MKRLITFLLIAAMLICMLPAFTMTVSAAEEPQQGLNATIWQSVADVEEGESGHADGLRRMMGWHGKGQSTSYETNEWFDATINQIIKTSHKWSTVGDGQYTFAQGFDRDSYKAVSKVNSDNEYLVQWTGTMRATTAGTYTFIGNALDNGVAIFVDGKKAFEWWGPDSWFENESLLSKYTFTITEEQVGKDIPFEMWFMELFGDERLKMSVTADGTAEGQKSMADAGLAFSLSATYYTYLLKGDEYDDLTQYMTTGEGKDASNAANHTFTESQLASMKGEMLEVGTSVMANPDSSNFYQKWEFEQFGAHYDCFIIEYTGYLTPMLSGEYQFGTSKVDNCYILQLKIDGEWKTVYEFWAKGIWNDSYTTYSADKFNLTAGTSYQLRAVFLELDGGEPLVTRYKINGNEYDTSGVLFTTEPYAAGQAPTKDLIFDAGSEWKYQLGSMENGVAPAAPEGWPQSIASTMQTGTTPIKDEWTTSDTPADGTQVNAYIWLAKEFTVDSVDDYKNIPLMADMYFDDDIRVYINGTEVYNYSRWNTGMTAYKLMADASELLVEGKNIIAVSLHQHHGDWNFNMRLYTTNADTSAYFPMYVAVDTADELIAYANMASTVYATDRNATHSAILDITADISMKGKVWSPITGFMGDIKGNGHTISDIVYINESIDGNKGLIVNDLVNYWLDNQPVENGTIRDLTVKNSLLYAPNTQWNAVGGIAGKLDRGCMYNCTVDDVTVIGGDWTGGIVGRSESGSINGALETPVMDCTIKNSTVIANTTTSTANKAIGGIVGTNDSRSKLLLGNYIMENVVIMCDDSWTLKANAVGAPDTTEGCAPVYGENKMETNVSIVATAAAAITAGADPDWSSAAPSVVKVTASTTDNSITAVKVNGQTLPASYYTLKETAEKVTVVTLKESFVQSLESGKYTVTIESYEGDVETTLNVVNDNVQEAPPTGDAILFLTLIATLSLAGTAFIARKRKSVNQ
ncbi:MAG: PA14 domain-containing protein [Eubacteriales bacterium]